MYVRAGEKFQRAIDINPAVHGALHNWGSALFERARTKKGDEADNLYEQACEKYRAARTLDPDYSLFYLNYGNARLFQAGNRDIDGSKELLVEAEESLKKAESLSPGSGAYDLACVYARMGNETECQRWLERTKELEKLPKWDHIAADPDLENIRNSKWFKDFLDQK